MGADGVVYTGTQAVSRAIALLKSFSDGRPEWHLSELADANGLNRSTTYRLLATLEHEGLVTRQAGSRLYRLGPEMVALGGCALRSHDVRSLARPLLQELAELCGEAATLEVLSGSEVIVLDETSGRHVVGMSQDVGSRLPAHATSTGKALLAYADDETTAATLAEDFAALTESTVVAAEELAAQFEEIRARGYAVADGELEAGFVAIAAPVFNHEGRAIAAVSVGGPEVRLTRARIEAVAAQVMEAARRLSVRLGYRRG